MLKFTKHTASRVLACVSKEPSRYAFHHAYLAIGDDKLRLDASRLGFVPGGGPDNLADRPQLHATDGRILVSIPLDSADPDEVPCSIDNPEDASGFVSPEALKELGKGAKKARPHSFLSANGSLEVRDGAPLTSTAGAREVPPADGSRATFPRNDPGEFPQIQAVISPRDEYVSLVIANPEYLAKVLLAIGEQKPGADSSPAVRIMLHRERPSHAAIRIEAAGESPANPGAVGLVMPLTLDCPEDGYADPCAIKGSIGATEEGENS